MATSTILSDSVDSLSSSRLLGSVSSLTPSKKLGQQLARAYKQAKNDFVQQRFVECLSTLEPLITPQEPDDDSSNGEKESVRSLAAPIASAEISLRVKVWSLYITLVSTIIDLGPDVGKAQFGSSQWRSMLAKVRDGSIWEEIVQAGYGGREGDVDPDVVANLANLLITHSPSQKLNQQRLEMYFSSARQPDLNISERFEDQTADSDPNHRPQRGHINGTDTPRDLNTRIKVLELYTLHVLPRNGEWEYAKEFISMSEILDEDRREEFLQTLQALEEQKAMDVNREAEIMRQKDEELERERQETEKRRQEESRLHEQPKQQAVPNVQNVANHKRSNSELDYGIEDPLPSNNRASVKTPGPSNLRKGQNGTRLTPRRTPGSVRKPTPRGFVARGAATITALQKLTANMAQSLASSPQALMRFVLFMLALLVMLGRRDIREKVAGAMGLGWSRVKQTLGMGVKVSYI